MVKERMYTSAEYEDVLEHWTIVFEGWRDANRWLWYSLIGWAITLMAWILTIFI